MLNWLFTSTPLLFFTQSLWRDEAFSYFLAKKSIIDIIVLSAKDFSPPLYHLVLHFWIKLFAGSEVGLRSLSLVFYWATVFVCYIFLEKIFKFNLKKSFIYLLLFLLNPFLLFYAFEARTYSFFAFLATLSYYSFYRKNYRLYLWSTLFGLYTHYFMLFVVLSQYIFLRISLNHNPIRFKIAKRDKYSLSLIKKTLIFFIPWVIYVIINKNLFSTFWIAPTDSQTFVRLPGIIYTGFESNVAWTSLFILLLLIIGFYKLKARKYKQDLNLIILFALWGIGIPLFVAVVSLIKPIFYPRYFIFAPIGLIFLLIYSLELIRYKARIMLLIILLIISVNYQKLLVEKRKKTDFQKTAAEIKPLTKKGDQILVTSELDFFTAKYYFPENQVLIYNKTYAEIPDFTGKVLISPSDLASSLSFYPNKSYLLKSNGDYEIQSLY